jgi:hypothetical protein
MSLKNKIVNIITSYPKLVTFVIGFAITFSIGIAIGMLDHNQLAEAIGNRCSGAAFCYNQ